jgi:hypothetical protein
MENQITSSKITNELSNIAPERWETPQLFKTDFDNTESGSVVVVSENTAYHS